MYYLKALELNYFVNKFLKKFSSYTINRLFTILRHWESNKFLN